MVIYKTKSGDTFDKIAYEKLGDSKYLPQLLKNNPDKLETFIFPAGIEIILPEIETEASKASALAWR